MSPLGLAMLGAATLLIPAPAVQAQKKDAPKKAVRAVRLTAAGLGARKPPTQDELKQRFDEKSAGAWLKNANWITDYDKARELAKASGKQIFAYFTRSYSP